jgi:hypothetical protein
MIKAVRTIAAATTILLSGCVMATAADAILKGPRSVRADCHQVRKCGPEGCVMRTVCSRGCPDGYSCYPLYGAYGPYGGIAYWGAYTDAGWGYRH